MRLAPRLSRFGTWIVGASLAARFFGCGDNLFVDRFMGFDALGGLTRELQYPPHDFWSGIESIFDGALSRVLPPARRS